jgi:hypothetical protein
MKTMSMFGNSKSTEMPAGLRVMMKSFGIDPQAMTETIGESVKAFMAKVDELQAIMNRVETNQQLLISVLRERGILEQPQLAAESETEHAGN